VIVLKLLILEVLGLQPNHEIGYHARSFVDSLKASVGIVPQTMPKRVPSASSPLKRYRPTKLHDVTAEDYHTNEFGYLQKYYELGTSPAIFVTPFVIKVGRPLV
jgi:hypothetical protein